MNGPAASETAIAGPASREDPAPVHAPARVGPVATHRIAFLDWLRASASLLVVWDHLVAEWLHGHQRGWLPLSIVENFVTQPFVITQNMGWLGVAVFFLISGFIISHVSSTESGVAFVVKRLLRIYPPLVFAIAVAVIASQWAVMDGTPARHTAGDFVLNATLANYFVIPQVIFLVVTWTLVIEMLFYASMALTGPLLRRGRGAFVPLVIMLLAGAFLLTGRRFGDHYFLLAVSFSYVPLLVLGQLIWLRWSRQISTAVLVVLSIGCWLLFVEGLRLYQPRFLDGDLAYGPSVLLAYALFWALLAKSESIRVPRVVRFLAERGYSIYLVHYPVGRAVLALLYGRLPFTLVLLATFATILAVVEVSYRLVERPSQRLARKLSVAWSRRSRPRVTHPQGKR